MTRITRRGEGNSGLDLGVSLTTLTALAGVDFSVRMPNDRTWMQSKVANTLNEIVDIAERTADDSSRVSQVVRKARNVKAHLSMVESWKASSLNWLRRSTP